MKKILVLSTIILFRFSVASDSYSLSQLTKLALASHPEIRMAMAAKQGVSADTNLSLSEFRPQLSLNGYGAFGNESAIFPSAVNPVNYGLLPTDGYVDGNVTFMMNLYSFGRKGLIYNAGKSSLSAADDEIEQKSNSVVQGIREALADDLYQQQRVQAYDAALISAREVERVSKERMDAGKIPEAFLLGAEADSAKAEQDVALAKADALGADASVWEAAGFQPKPSDSIGIWDVQLAVPASLSDSIEAALQNRPDYLAIKNQEDAIRLTAKSISRSGLPQLNFLAMGDLAGSRSANNLSGYKAGIVLSIPIGDGGLRSSQISQQKSKLDQLLEVEKLMKNHIIAEVTKAMAKWQASSVVFKASKSELAFSQESYRVALIRYKEGKSILAELSSARTQVTNSLLSVAAADQYARKSWSELMGSMGASN